MIIALINTFARTSTSEGAVVSYHRTVQAARNAEERLQRVVKRANGRDAYLPTWIVRLHHKPEGIAVPSNLIDRSFDPEEEG